MPWGFFGWLWWRVGHGTTVGQLVVAAGLVCLLAVVSVSITSVWIIHNVRIYRRKGTRQGLPSPDLDYKTDWTRRPVVADWPAVRRARVIVVIATTELKVFLPGTPAECSGFTGAVEKVSP